MASLAPFFFLGTLLAPFPHISGVISWELWVVDWLAGEGVVGDVEEVEDLALEVRELGVEDAEGDAMVEDDFALS